MATTTTMESQLRKTVKTDVPIFRDRLRKALDDREISQRQLALSIGKDPRTVNHVFKGPVHPDLGTLREFCEKLNVSADWLLGLSDVQEEHKAPQTLHRFANLDDITDMSKKLYTAPSYSHLDIECMVVAPINNDLYEPTVLKTDLLCIDVSVKEVTKAAMYVTSWKGEPDIYANYALKTANSNGETIVACKCPEGTKGWKIGMEHREYRPEQLDVHGLVVGRYTDSIL